MEPPSSSASASAGTLVRAEGSRTRPLDDVEAEELVPVLERYRRYQRISGVSLVGPFVGSVGYGLGTAAGVWSFSWVWATVTAGLSAFALYVWLHARTRTFLTECAELGLADEAALALQRGLEALQERAPAGDGSVQQLAEALLASARRELPSVRSLLQEPR